MRRAISYSRRSQTGPTILQIELSHPACPPLCGNRMGAFCCSSTAFNLATRRRHRIRRAIRSTLSQITVGPFSLPLVVRVPVNGSVEVATAEELASWIKPEKCADISSRTPTAGKLAERVGSWLVIQACLIVARYGCLRKGYSASPYGTEPSNYRDATTWNSNLTNRRRSH